MTSINNGDAATYTGEQLHDGAGRPVDQQGRALPPHDLDTERLVLGTLLDSAQARTDAHEHGLSNASFYTARHQEIWHVITTLTECGEPCDAVAVNYALQQRGTITRVGPTYVADLAGCASPVGGIATYLAMLRDYEHRRHMQQLVATLDQLTHQPGSTTEVLETARDRLTTAIEATPDAGADIQSIGAGSDELLEHLERVATGQSLGLPTGIADLDDVTNGLHPGQLVTIAARPGVGKSTLGMDLARSASLRQDQATLVCSLEMSRRELLERVYAAEARVRLSDMRGGTMSDDDWTRLSRRMGELSDAPLYIDDTTSGTLAEIKTRARRLAQHVDLRLIVVDYLQLLTTSQRGERREQEVSEFSRGLKLLAKELDIPVVAISQLNRAAEQRADKKPVLSDLRESGAIEQDSDVVLLMHRPDVQEQDSPRMGEADLILAKHRGGPTSTVTVAHQLHYSRFVDLAPE